LLKGDNTAALEFYFKSNSIGRKEAMIKEGSVLCTLILRWFISFFKTMKKQVKIQERRRGIYLTLPLPCIILCWYNTA